MNEEVNTKSKRQRLIEGLAKVFKCEPKQIDFENDIEDTKWKHTDKYGWEPCVKSHIQSLPKVIPDPKNQCYCGTAYEVNHLVRHIPTGRYAVVGSVCIKKFGGKMVKRCPGCHNPSRKKSVYCGDCRIMCSKCEIYHDDNSVHHEVVSDPLEISRINFRSKNSYPTRYIEHPLNSSVKIIMEPMIEPQSTMTPLDTSPVLRLKKHKGKTMLQVLREDNPYIGWLLTDAASAYLEPQEKVYLKTELASKVMSVGKYSHMTWAEVKQTQPGMIKWYVGKKPEYSWLNDL